MVTPELSALIRAMLDEAYAVEMDARWNELQQRESPDERCPATPKCWPGLCCCNGMPNLRGIAE